MIQKEMGHNLHYGEVRGKTFHPAPPPPHPPTHKQTALTPAAVK